MATIPRMPLRRGIRLLKSSLPEFNFITGHYLYFIITALLSALVFWGSSTAAKEVSFTDSLFLVISAMTQAGLNTVNLSTLNTWQQIMLFLLILLGSPVFVSAFIVAIRRRAFEHHFCTELEAEGTISRRIFKTLGLARTESSGEAKHDDMASREQRNPRSKKRFNNVPHEDDQKAAGQRQANINTMLSTGEASVPEELQPHREAEAEGFTTTSAASSSVDNSEIMAHDYKQEHISFNMNTQPGVRQHANYRTSGNRFFGMSGVGARPMSAHSFTLHSPVRRASNIGSADHNHTTGSMNRNSAFHNLTFSERERLGGAEYKAVVFLSWIIPFYFVIFQLLSCISLGAYISNYYASTTRDNGLNPWWVGSFNAVSAFNNNGMSLLDLNMTTFSRSVFVLLTMGMLILAGNTCFPVILRTFIWTVHKLLPDSEIWADRKYTLKFLLDHPRRCFTHLFPSKHTWWLLSSVITLNGIDCAMFIILNIGNPNITRLAPGYEFIDGLFQALAVRSGGFYVVNISQVRISLQVLYVVMMYISVYPMAITIRNSNIYEERSLGIYSDDPQYEARTITQTQTQTGRLSWLRQHFIPENESSRRYFIQQQLRAQLAHDLWWLVLAVFLITIVEGDHFESDPAVFSVFNVILETVSAYGTVGISVGLPDENYSFCGAWHKLSKLILCTVMLRGRHRGLPVAIDKAILLPHDDHLASLEDQDARIRQERASTAGVTQAV